MGYKGILFGIIFTVVFLMAPFKVFGGGKIPVQGFVPGTTDLNKLNAGLPASEYGYHPDNDGSWGESWSMQAGNEAGDFVYVLMSISNYHPFHKFGGTLDLFYYPADGGKYKAHSEFKNTTVSADKKSVQVNLDGNTFSGIHPNYRIKASLDDLSFDLKFKVETPSLRLGQSYIYFGKNKERYWNLTALGPRATVSGTISVKGKNIPFKGLAYFDHGWSTEKIYKFSKRWYVLRVLEDDLSINAIQMNLKDDYEPNRAEAIFITLGDKIIANSGAVKITPNGSIQDSKSGLTLPKQYTVNYDQGGTRLTGTITVAGRVTGVNVLEQLSPMLRKIVAALVTDPWQFRYEGKADLTLEHNGQTRKITGPVIGEVHHYK